MSYTTIISAADAVRFLDDDNWAFIDCRFVLRDAEQGYKDYQASHIQGAVYAHLDRDLSGSIIPERTGRHPLPDPDALVATFSSWGIGPETQVVAYDESSGAMAAARLWWLLRWAGHDAVAVLDGGLKHWIKLGYPTTAGVETRKPRASQESGDKPPHSKFRNEMAATADDVLKVLDDPAYRVIDVRSADRYRGENETLDRVAGHIAGAVSLPFTGNIEENGLFKPAADLASSFDSATAGADSNHTMFYCGSGVTAAHTVLAYVHAGKGFPRLYAGSWSQWITDKSRPIAIGAGAE